MFMNNLDRLNGSTINKSVLDKTHGTVLMYHVTLTYTVAVRDDVTRSKLNGSMKSADGQDLVPFKDTLI